MVQQGRQSGDQKGPTPGIAGVHPKPQGLLTFLQAHRSQISESAQRARGQHRDGKRVRSGTSETEIGVSDGVELVASAASLRIIYAALRRPRKRTTLGKMEKHDAKPKLSEVGSRSREVRAFPP